MPPLRVGVGDGDGAAGMFNRLQRGSLTGVGHIHHHADAVHFGHHLAAHTGQARVVMLITARRQQRLVVIGQLHEPDTQLVADFDQTDVVLNRAGILEAKEDRRAPGFLRQLHVGSTCAFENQIRVILKPAVPAF